MGNVLQRLEALGVSPANLRIAKYWLSLCEDGTLPSRAALDPAGFSEFLRYCGLFDVVPGKSVYFRIAGLVSKLANGEDMTNKDWLAHTPAHQRAQRLARYSAVAVGAVGIGRRQALREGGGTVRIEEIMLPFSDVGEGGVRYVLAHTDWRPEGPEWLGVDATYAATLADEFHLVPLD